MKLDAVQMTLFADQLQSVCEEMGQVLQLSAYSPNIRERRDFSTALFDASGRLVAQGHNIPVHLGSMSTAVQAVLEAARRRGDELAAGDVLLVNDPFEGGTHLPDITAVAPYFVPGRSAPLAILAARAHHADVGGMSSGSLPMSTELYQEGLIIPPVWLLRRGELQEDVLRLICANSRTASERQGDLLAQLASLRRGVTRLQELGHKAGADHASKPASAASTEVFRAMTAYSSRAMQELRRRLPLKSVEAEDFLELGDKQVWIRLVLTVERDGLIFDFRGSDPQAAGPLNAVRAITMSAVFYLLRCLLPPEVPCTSGLLDEVEVLTRSGSIVDARPPAAVAGGNVETSQRIVDVLLQAWGRLEPDIAVACSQGTMNNLTIGGQDRRWGESIPFAYYETMGGGHGASSEGPGLSGRHSHMTNSLNTPIESLEHAYPLRIRAYGLRQSSGGSGHFDGGSGLVREIELLSDCDVTVLSQRRRRGAPGVAGGSAGKPGCNQVCPGVPARSKTEDAGFSRRLKAGSRVTIESPGGGGWGKAT